MARTLTLEGGLAVEGLTESIRGLARVDKEAARLVTDEIRYQARRVVLPAARSNWSSQPIRPTQANSAVTAQADQKGASLVLRYSAHPYAAGVEFGSHQYRQFRSWRGNRFTVAPGSSTGYVVQDAIRATLPQVEETLIKELARTISNYVGLRGLGGRRER
jgi:hypothetical protein